MEEIQRTKQYAYSANSNLVLTSQTARLRDAGPSSDVKSLRALDLEQLKSEMGSRVTRERPMDLVQRLAKTRTREQQVQDVRQLAQQRKQQQSVLELAVGGVYQPSTRESRAAYEVLLSFIQQHIGDKPRDVLMDAAHEVLVILKAPELKLRDKQQEVSSLLFTGGLSEDTFATLWNISEKIADFRDDASEEVLANPDAQEEALDQDMGVPIVFDDDDEQEAEEPAESEYTMQLDAEEDDGNQDGDDDNQDEEDQEDLDVDVAAGIKDKGRGRRDRDSMVDDGDDERKHNELDARAIDAYWLQRELGKFYGDALESQRLATQVLEMLSDLEGTKDHACENKLVLLLGWDRFDFIKLLMRNRRKIVWCVRRARAKEGRERTAIEAEMLEDPELRVVLEQLHRSATERSEIERRLAREARGLQQTRDVVDGTGADSSSIIVSGSKSLPSSAAEDELYWNRRPKNKLDLEALSFEGGHFMSNKGCKVPKGTEFLKHKGYQEVIIRPKAQVGSALADSEDPSKRRVPVTELPQWAQPAFRGLESLNRVQSQVYPCALLTKENMLLCAPTSAGKTNVALLAMLREIGEHLRPATPDDPEEIGVWVSGEDEDPEVELSEEELRKHGQRLMVDTSAFKIVYVAPMKSLVQEMCMSFSKRLAPYGVAVRELSGDVQLSRQEIQDTQVIVTTPEKWDIITRKTGDRNVFAQLVRLIIVDEIHLLHDSRGPVLESIVARSIRLIESSQQLTRLVGLSATLPNYEDVALFLRVNPEKGLFFFDSQFRPCPLFQSYIGLSVKSAFKRMQLMNEITYDKTMDQVKKGNQVLIFVHSRKETANTAKVLRDLAQEKDEDHFVCPEGARQMLLSEEAETVSDKHLKDLLSSGFGIHHAGMNREDRTRVEELFDDGHIRVLVSTATLAWGVNLPAHAVIIKGTEVYSSEKGAWTELSPLDVMQMMGRAGRPQHDTYGEGVIVTSFKHLNFYLSLLNEQLPVESQFIRKLPDNLNAEIVLGSVSNVREAVNWLGYTYLYVRMLRNPGLYGISFEEIESDPTLEQRRVDLVHSAALLLDRSRLIKYDRKSGNFQVTELGRVASHYYITYQSVAAFNEYLKPNLSDIELLRIFSLSTEFQNMSVRQEEKLELVKLLDTTPIPIKEAVTEPSAKCNVLLQAYISGLSLEGFALRSDLVYITQSAGRVLRALFEILLRRGWAQPARQALELCKMVDRRMWAAQSPLRQFAGAIPPEVIRRIEGKDFGWERLYHLEPHALGELVRMPKYGKRLHKAVHQLPRLELQAHVQPVTRSLLRCELTLTPDFRWSPKVHGNAEAFWLLVEDVDGETLLHYEYFVLKAKLAEQEHIVTFTVPIQDPMPPQYFIRVVSDRWLGSETVLPVSFRHLILPQPFPAPTELLDLQPLSTQTIAHKDWITFFSDRFEVFNPIQTMAFKMLFDQSQPSAFVASPPGSGKTVLAEIAIIRMLMSNPGARAVYIAPVAALVDLIHQSWSKSFGSRGISVTKLTGESGPDLRLLAEGQIVLATPEQWDVISRRWMSRKAVQEVALLVLDELHLLGGESGPVLEVVVSRMRYMASRLKRHLRILGLAASVANGRDMGEWLGADASCILCFHPNRRPVPLEIRIQGYEHTHFETMLQAMVKPAYRQILQLAEDRPALLFVPSRRHAEQIALDMVAMRASDPSNPRWLRAADAEQLQAHLRHVGNRRLQQSLLNGVAFFHAGLTPTERGVVQHLVNHGVIQVLVADHTECWALNTQAGLVQVLGAQYWEGREHRHVDLSMAALLQMMARASPSSSSPSPTQRQDAPPVGRFSLFCHLSRKEFYKKFLNEPFPVESHLDHGLADHLNAEIVHGRVSTVQEAVDYLTWSFYYRRLAKNPNYYGMAGVSHRHISDHLSELVENVLEELVRAGCISREAGEDDVDEEREDRRRLRQTRIDDPHTSVEEREALQQEQDEDEAEEGSNLTPLNLGMIAAYYNLHCQTVELFAQSLSAGSGIKQLLEILSNASEFDGVPLRHKEDSNLRALSRRLPLIIPRAEESSYADPHVKVHALLQAHFSRLALNPQAQADQSEILLKCSAELQAMVDVLASSGWLKPALATMELSQMVTQGLWNHESPLLQLPHVAVDFVERARKQFRVSTVPELLELEDEDRAKLFQGLSVAQVNDVALMCNNFPDLDCEFQLVDEEDEGDEEQQQQSFPSGGQVQLQVRVTRDAEEDDEEEDEPADNGVPVASTPRFPVPKLEGWWVLLGRPSRNELLSIKRLSLRRQGPTDLQLNFTAPEEGRHELTLFLMSDSYLGVDQEYKVPITVAGRVEDRMSDDEDEE